MCLISDQIKFCSCKMESGQLPENYWILYRYVKVDEDKMIVGEAQIPTNFYDENCDLNTQTLLDRLNDPTSFDREFIFRNNDHFHVCIKNPDFYEDYNYSFRFWDSKWKLNEYYPYINYGNLKIKTVGKLEDF